MQELLRPTQLIPASLGSDETGTGDYLTPIVSACVYVPSENREQLIRGGAGDSKQLSDSHIVSFFNRYRHLFLYSWNSISQARYNRLTASFNANQIKLFLHYSNISSFLRRHPNLTDRVVIDCFSTPSSIKGYERRLFASLPELDIERLGVKIEWVVKAESSHLEVALASMVARYYLLKLVSKQEARWELSFPLGASERVELAAREFIKRYGREQLGEVAKLNFKNTARVLGGEV